MDVCGKCGGPVTKGRKTGLCRPCLHAAWPERFWIKVAKDLDNGCWGWIGALSSAGYGNFHCKGRYQRAHRVAYELTVGPIPEGLELDHLCRNRSCVNPSHLEPVSHQENVLRGSARPAVNARKTHCPRGHEYAGDNLYMTSQGKRHCRACHVLRQREYRMEAVA